VRLAVISVQHVAAYVLDDAAGGQGHARGGVFIASEPTICTPMDEIAKLRIVK